MAESAVGSGGSHVAPKLCSMLQRPWPSDHAQSFRFAVRVAGACCAAPCLYPWKQLAMLAVLIMRVLPRHDGPQTLLRLTEQPPHSCGGKVLLRFLSKAPAARRHAATALQAFCFRMSLSPSDSAIPCRSHASTLSRGQVPPMLGDYRLRLM